MFRSCLHDRLSGSRFIEPAVPKERSYVSSTRNSGMPCRPSVCFNCHHHWRGVSPLEWRGRAQPTTESLALFTFGPVEAARLVVYRAAVQSGFFSDWPTQRVA